MPHFWRLKTFLFRGQLMPTSKYEIFSLLRRLISGFRLLSALYLGCVIFDISLISILNFNLRWYPTGTRIKYGIRSLQVFLDNNGVIRSFVFSCFLRSDLPVVLGTSLKEYLTNITYLIYRIDGYGVP